MPVISSDFRIPNDNRSHIKVDVVYGEKLVTMVALADTGAQSCCISNERASELHLPILGKTQIKGSAGTAASTRGWTVEKLKKNMPA